MVFEDHSKNGANQKKHTSKKSIFMLIFFLLSSIAGFAQVKKIVINVEGDFEVVVKVGNDAFVTINPEGEILDTEINGSISYYNGKISSVGGISFSYYNGRVSSVGGISFSYYNGKISSIGRTSFSYYNGKISSIGGTSVSYYNGKISSIGGNGFSYYNGKLSSGNRSFISNGMTFKVTGGN